MIGYAYVVGDILHVGHLLHLRNCKRLCDRLIVGVLTDEAAMEKKPKPSVPFEQRIQLVAALRYVDAAVPQHTYSPRDNIWSIRPDVLFECAAHDEVAHLDHNGELLVRTHAMPYYPEQSSTHIKEIIRNAN